MEKEKEQINAQYLELWRKNYAQPSEAADVSTVSKVVELETALESREGRLKQLSLQVNAHAHVHAHAHELERAHARMPIHTTALEGGTGMRGACRYCLVQAKNVLMCRG